MKVEIRKGKEIVEGMKINNDVLSTVYEYDQINGGYFIRLLKEPLDFSNIKHIEFSNKINDLLGLGK